MPGKPYQSILIPYKEDILGLRRQRPPMAYARIAELLKEKHQVLVQRAAICKFVKLRVRWKKKGAWENRPASRNWNTVLAGSRTACRTHKTVVNKLKMNFRLYDLRHTFGSRAAMAGVDLPTLKELMGHSVISMTMRYVHPTPAHKIEAMEKLQRFNHSPQESPQGTITSP